MIKIIKLYWANPIIGKKLTKFEERQMARQIEKFLLRRYSIVCEVEVV